MMSMFETIAKDIPNGPIHSFFLADELENTKPSMSA